ncbi:MAG TPA: fibronectin type III domain-containing protein, partial [Candidatus Dormibacteraeota bacterium]|nr:fibronectin type III domain-containing protein [Candidatus Dormibacteraeota bacterium]
PPSCGTPINNLLTANGGGTATFTWMPVGEGCTAFALYIYSPSGARLVETLNSNSLAVTGLNPNNWYTFTIIGWNGSRWVAWANYAPWVQVT